MAGTDVNVFRLTRAQMNLQVVSGRPDGFSEPGACRPPIPSQDTLPDLLLLLHFQCIQNSIQWRFRSTSLHQMHTPLVFGVFSR